MKRWLICPIVGTGTSKDAYRPKLRDLGVDYVAHIPSNPDGTPKFNWCICLASAIDFTVVDADVQIDGFPGVALTDELGSFSAAVRNKIQTALTNRGVDLTGITLTSTVGDVLRRAGQKLGATWDFGGTSL
jgi:hypothetical protein